jgi:CMP/dCMP kinase
MPEERLQKVLAAAGLGSRRACEELILAGRVTVDGLAVTELGRRVDPEEVEIRVDGQPIAREHYRYIVLHKPAGYLSHPDPRAGYPDWSELVKAPERLYAVGRLDVDSEGLLLLTNDGGLANRLTHPRYEHPKTYLVQVQGFPNPRKLRRMQHGVMLDDGPTAPAQVELLRDLPADLRRPVAVLRRPSSAGRLPAQGEARPEAGGNGHNPRPPARARANSWLKITLREGRKRQLRRMVALLGHPALRVVRIGLGPLVLGELHPGQWRDLTAAEVRSLRSLALPEPAAVEGSEGEAPAGRLPRKERKARPLPSTIAIDGPAASGKSTIGGRLARELGYLYFDTGVMYRAITCVALNRGFSPQDEAGVSRLAEQVRLDVRAPAQADPADGRDVTVLADGVDITHTLRGAEIERAIQPISGYRDVRAALTQQQRRIGQAGRVVMVGRDIGTVVMPGADLKIYLDASLRERAHRRWLECTARGRKVTEEVVAEELRRRDHADANRQHAPLAIAHDAIVVDSTELSVDQVMERMYLLVRRWGERKQSK